MEQSVQKMARCLVSQIGGTVSSGKLSSLQQKERIHKVDKGTRAQGDFIYTYPLFSGKGNPPSFFTDQILWEDHLAEKNQELIILAAQLAAEGIYCWSHPVTIFNSMQGIKLF